MIFFLLKFLAFYLPWSLALNPAEGIDLASLRILIILIFFLWLVVGLKKRRIFVVSGAISGLIVLFLAINLLSLFWAKNIDWAARKALFLFSIFPLFFVFAEAMKDNGKMIKIAKILVISGALVSILGIIQFVSQFYLGIDKVYDFWAGSLATLFLGKSLAKEVLRDPSWLVNISGMTFLRATATFPDPHMFSLYLGMLLPLAAGIYLKVKNKLYVIFFFLILTADMLTFSRGGYLGLLGGAAFLAAAFWKNIAGRYKIFALVFFLAVGLSFFIPGPVASRFNSIFDLREGSNAGRLEMWEKSWKVAQDSPFLGVGLGNYPLEIKPSADYREPITAHNTYLDIASETGMISALIWTAILSGAIIIFLGKSKRDNFFLMSATSVAIFSAHSLAETSIYSPAVLALLLIIISFIYVSENQKNI